VGVPGQEAQGEPTIERAGPTTCPACQERLMAGVRTLRG
jgi:hypothetical protein